MLEALNNHRTCEWTHFAHEGMGSEAGTSDATHVCLWPGRVKLHAANPQV